MAWFNPFSWGRESLAEEPLPKGGGKPDLSDFSRQTWLGDLLGSQDLIYLASWASGCRPDTPPEQVPITVLDAMGYHPVVYLGEHIVTAPATDPELYYLRGDPKHVAEVEAWLRPLLTLQRAPLLAQIARAFAYGAIPIVLDWQLRAITAQVVGTGDKPRNRNLPAHAHYGRSHELWPADVQLRVDKSDRLLGVIHGQQEYGGEDLDELGQRRAFLAIWDPAFGRWTGQAARRRAYRDWIEEGMSRLWEIRYTERSVDLPRVGFAPEGKLKVDGREVSAVGLLRAQLMSLRNGSTITLPSTQDANGNKAWGVDILNVPDRHAIFAHVIDSRGARMLQANLCPASLDKANEEQLMDSVQRVCDFVARTLTRIVNVPLQLRYGPDVPMVTVVANDIPKRKQRIVQEVFRAVAALPQTLADGRTYTLGELVDPEILDQLGIKARSVEEAAHKPAAPAPGTPGAKVDVASEREERRDGAKTVEGESDTGGKDEPREERMTRALTGEPQIIINNVMPAQPPPTVNVETAPAQVNVAAPNVTVQAAAPLVLPPAQVTNVLPAKTVHSTVQRDNQGRITSVDTTETREAA